MRTTPYRSTAWQTHRPLVILVGLISVIFLVQAVVSSDWELPLMAVPAEVVASVQEFRNGEFSLQGGAEIATLWSCTLLHANAEHLLFNMIFLWMFAALALELLGARWMIALFLVTGFFGSVCHVVLNADETVPMLGASGGVMGFEGAYLAMALRWRLPNPHVWPISRPIPPANLALFALVGIAGDYFGLLNRSTDFVAYGAHIGGFLSGIFLTGFLAPRPKGAHPR